MKLTPYINLKLSIDNYQLLFQLLEDMAETAIKEKTNGSRTKILRVMRAITRNRTQEYIKGEENV